MNGDGEPDPGDGPADPEAVVEYGGLSTVPGPFECTEATITMVGLRADPDKLAALCRTALADPTGRRTYRPVGELVLLSFGSMLVRPLATGRSELFGIPYDQMGRSRERHAALWVLTEAEHRRDDIDLIDRVAVFIPAMWVDNPVSLLGGRDIYGFAKQWGEPTLTDTPDGPGCTLDVFGGDFGPDATSGMRRLFELVPEAASNGWAGVGAAVGELGSIVRDELGRLRHGQLDLPDVRLLHELAGMVTHRQVTQVCRRQPRPAADDGAGPAPAELVEVATRFETVAAHPLHHRFAFTLHDLDSHPLGRTLGIGSQTVDLGLRLEATFTLGLAAG